MSIRKVLFLLPSVLLVGLMGLLSGCGWASEGTTGTPSGKPDSVSILIDEPSPTPEPGKPVVTLTVAKLVEQLYATIYALPQMPDNQGCPADLGPHYTLTFRQGAKILVTVIAMRDGCLPVSIAGEGHDRQATEGFWSQLDAGIYAGTPPAKVEWFAIERQLQGDAAPESARVTSEETTQRLYQAILALPLVPQVSFYADGSQTYQVVFHAVNQTIPSIINEKRGLISLEGKLQSRGGVYAMNAAFQHLLEEILAGVSFAPARPDSATLTVNKLDSTSQQMEIAGGMMQRLYMKVLSLHSTQAQTDCPSEEDKVAGKGTFYEMSFMQWGLPILPVSVYEGSCRQVEINSTNQFLEGDAEFWDLLHQAAD